MMHSLPDRVIVTLDELLITCVQSPFASVLDAVTLTALAGSGDKNVTVSKQAAKAVLSFMKPAVKPLPL
jgi:hypothetical protein